jgi:hypothetical protein
MKSNNTVNSRTRDRNGAAHEVRSTFLSLTPRPELLAQRYLELASCCCLAARGGPALAWLSHNYESANEQACVHVVTCPCGVGVGGRHARMVMAVCQRILEIPRGRGRLSAARRLPPSGHDQLRNSWEHGFAVWPDARARARPGFRFIAPLGFGELPVAAVTLS